MEYGCQRRDCRGREFRDLYDHECREKDSLKTACRDTPCTRPWERVDLTLREELAFSF